jgi:branched-chain amino acid transport system permease protein
LIGAVFALIAYGLALVWGVMNVKNLAQGDFVILGAYVTWTLFNWGIHPFLGIPAAFCVLWVLGWCIYKLVIYRVIEHDLFTSLLATFGVAIVLQQSMNLIFGSDEQTVSLGLESISLLDNAVTIQPTRLVAFFCAIALAIAVITFMKRSRMGQAIRATSQNARAARVMGIDTEKVYAFTYSLNAAICGAAGALVAVIWEFQPFIGLIFSIRSFVIVTAAGLGNLPGVIAAGLGMGVLEQTGAFILGTQFQQAIVVGMLVVVLLIKLLIASRKRQVVDT